MTHTLFFPSLFDLARATIAAWDEMRLGSWAGVEAGPADTDLGSVVGLALRHADPDVAERFVGALTARLRRRKIEHSLKRWEPSRAERGVA